MHLTLTDDSYHYGTIACNEGYRWESITDPRRYDGGPDPIWTGGKFLMLLYRNDGSVWGMENPFQRETFSWWQTNRNFNYHEYGWDTDCEGDLFPIRYDRERHDYEYILLPLEDMPLLAD